MDQVTSKSECSALELRVRLALAAAPGHALAEGSLAKAIGRATRAERDALFAKLAGQNVILIEPARRGRRVRLLAPALTAFGSLRVPPRARFTGATLNALLAAVARPAAVSTADVREAVLAEHATHARGPAAMADLAAIRAALPHASRADVDQALLALERERKLVLGRAVDLAALSPDARAAAIDDPSRGLLVYASRPEHAPVSP